MSIATLPVHYPGGEYPIHIGEGLLSELGALVRSHSQAERAALVSNVTVDALYGNLAAQCLTAAGFQVTRAVLPDGEQYKTLAQVSRLYEQFIKGELDRHSPVIALGGGVIGDMTGFAAATYLRGVPFFQVPTSLLAMVDASVGGKVGVDLPQGKNLVGAFKQPEMVLIDPGVLRSLSPPVLAEGMAEVIKHGVIADPELFEHIEQSGTNDLAWIVQRAVRVKTAVVEADPFEQGRRAVLNLGHTFAHALEQVTHYQLSHGQAVGVGLVAAAHLSLATGRTDAAFVKRLTALVAQVGLPIRSPGLDPEAVRQAMGTDKKRVGQRLRFILPIALGDVVIADDVADVAVFTALEAVL